MSNTLTPQATVVTARLSEIIEEIAGVPKDDVRTDSHFTDLDIDSLTLVEVVVAAEECFQVAIGDELVKDFKTVGNIVDHVLGVV